MPYAEEDHEVYPNPPLKLVAAEVRYPLAPRLTDSERLNALQDALEAQFPIYQPMSEKTVEVGVADGEGSPTLKSSTHSIFRALAANRTASATIAPTRTIVEVSEYTRYGDYRRLIEGVLRALEGEGQPRFFDRLGLRYVDEVRVPSITELPGDWEPFIAPELLGPAALGRGERLDPHSWDGMIRFDTGIQSGVRMRYGVAEGAAINPSGALKIRPSIAPVYFLIDLDSFWLSSGEFVRFDLEQVLNMFDELHRPIRDLFETVITERLRDEVLRREVTRHDDAKRRA